MDKYELNNIQFVLEINRRKKLGAENFSALTAHGAAGFLKDEPKLESKDSN